MAPRKPRDACGGGGGGGGPRRAAAPGHRLPERLPAGLVLTDVRCQRWRLGRSVGVGGFGEIYLAEAADAPAADAAHVVKIEPHSNGPLFAEMHCYHRVARAETMEAWQRERRLRRLGMSRFVASGSVEHAGKRYRFMVMERFGSDLQKLLNQAGGRFPVGTVLNIGLQVLDTLEYIHSREYIHADIKAQNLLLGYKKGTENQVYLVDFGLACRYALSGRHKPHRPDLRKAHDGTIEFTSRDAHIGAHSRRGDLEVLGYNLLQWAAGRLPWQDRLHDPDAVAEEKNRHMTDVAGLVRECFPAGVPAGVDAIQQYLELVAGLGFDTAPDYDALRGLLRAGLRPLGSPGRLVFAASDQVTCASRRRRPRSRSGARPAAKRRRLASGAPSGASDASAKSGQENTLGRARRAPGRRGRQPLRLVTDNTAQPPPPPPQRSSRQKKQRRVQQKQPQPQQKQESPPPTVTSPALRSDGKLHNFDWQHFNQVVEMKQKRRAGSGRQSGSDGGGDSPDDPAAPRSPYTVHDNITPAMRAVLLKRLARSPEKGDARGKKRGRAYSCTWKWCEPPSTPVTPAMAAVLLIRQRRLAAASEPAGRRARPGRSAGGGGALAVPPEPRPALRTSRRLRCGLPGGASPRTG